MGYISFTVVSLNAINKTRQEDIEPSRGINSLVGFSSGIDRFPREKSKKLERKSLSSEEGGKLDGSRM